jgi:hypothetical protein
MEVFMAATGGRIVLTPGEKDPYKVVLEHEADKDTEQPVQTMEQGEALIKKETPTPPTRDTTRDRPASDEIHTDFLKRRERKSVASAAGASSGEARIAHEGLARSYADRLDKQHEAEIASSAPFEVTQSDGEVHIVVPGQPDALLTPEAATATADSLLSGARKAGRQTPHAKQD